MRTTDGAVLRSSTPATGWRASASTPPASSKARSASGEPARPPWTPTERKALTPVPLGHPHPARSAPRHPRRPRPPAGLPGRTRPAALRLRALLRRHPPQLRRDRRPVNGHVLDDPEVRIWHAARADAEAAGAIALFGEKYGDTVRIVDIGDFSRELCGGTHVGHGSNAGPVRVLGESSIGSNLRRIEALTGRDALTYWDSERRLLEELSDLLGTRPKDAPGALRKRLEALATAQQELNRLRVEELRAKVARLAEQARQVEGGLVIAEKITGVEPGELRQLAAEVADRLQASPTVVVLGLEHNGKAMLVAAVSRDLADAGVQAAEVITRAAKAVGGGGGGTGAVASAGGRCPEHLDEALILAGQDASRLLGGR